MADDFGGLFSVGDLFGGSGLSSFDTSIPSFELQTPSFALPDAGGATTAVSDVASAADTGLTSSFSPDIPLSLDRAQVQMPATDLGTSAPAAAAPAAPAAPPGAPTTPGMPGWLSTASGYANALKPFLELGLGAGSAYLGVQALNEAAGQNKLLTSAEKRAGQAQQTAQQTAAVAREAAAPQVAATEALTPVGVRALLGGPLPPELEANIDQWKREAKAAAASYYSKAGIQDSTMMAQLDSWIEEQAQQLRTSYAEALLQSGTAAGAAAVGGISAATGAAGTAGAGQAGTLPLREQDTLASAIQNANQALYNLLGRTG